MITTKRNVLMKQPAPFFRRFFAYLIDALLLVIIIYLPLQTQTPLQTDAFFSDTFELSTSIIALATLAALLSIFYWAILEFFLHQSIGKMIMRIKVISDTNTLTFAQCILRNITKMSSLPLLIDCIPIFKKRKRFSEYIAKTSVVVT